MSIRVRFAPSPTGDLHVGGARTAIFNWLYSRSNNGLFLLRIEDTDKERSTDEMTTKILEGLKWLGLDWDEELVYQSKNIERHISNLNALLDNNKAYKCFCDPDVLKLEREDAQKKGVKSWKYPGHCRNLSDEEIQKREENGDTFAVRFKVPEDGVTGFNDLAHGKTEFKNENIDDFILARSDGSPTYHLSVVSDDISMQITHIIRGDDHISNTPKQILLYKALDAEVPNFAHIPLILGTDKKRLSKRHGATAVVEYKDKGYLPETMFNYLSLLGWSPGEDREYLPREELIQLFGLSGVGKAGAVFDEQKLQWLNGQYISELSAEKLYPYVREYFEKAGCWAEEYAKDRNDWFLSLIELLKERCRLLSDFPIDATPYISDKFEYDEKGVKKHFKGDDLISRLKNLKNKLESLEHFTLENTETVLRELAEQMDISAAKLIHPLRMAMLGVPVSPGVFDVAVFIGKEKVLTRIERLIKWLEKKK